MKVNNYIARMSEDDLIAFYAYLMLEQKSREENEDTTWLDVRHLRMMISQVSKNVRNFDIFSAYCRNKKNESLKVMQAANDVLAGGNSTQPTNEEIKLAAKVLGHSDSYVNKIISDLYAREIAPANCNRCKESVYTVDGVKDRGGYCIRCVKNHTVLCYSCKDRIDTNDGFRLGILYYCQSCHLGNSDMRITNGVTHSCDTSPCDCIVTKLAA